MITLDTTDHQMTISVDKNTGAKTLSIGCYEFVSATSKYLTSTNEWADDFFGTFSSIHQSNALDSFEKIQQRYLNAIQTAKRRMQAELSALSKLPMNTTFTDLHVCESMLHKHDVNMFCDLCTKIES